MGGRLEDPRRKFRESLPSSQSLAFGKGKTRRWEGAEPEPRGWRTVGTFVGTLHQNGGKWRATLLGARRVRATPGIAFTVSILLTLLANIGVIILLVQRREYLPVWIPLIPIFLVRYGIEKWRVGRGLRCAGALRVQGIRN
jgi:hypothetical protein